MRSAHVIILLFIVSTGFSQPYPDIHVTKRPGAPRGYYLLSPLYPPTVSTDTSHNGWNLILDGDGNAVYYRRFPGSKKTTGLRTWTDGQLTYFQGERAYMLDSTFRICREVVVKDHQTDHHEIISLPNKGVALLGTETFTMDLSRYRYFNHHLRSAGSATALVISGLIQEQDSLGRVVWEWHAKDHFKFYEVDSFYLSDPTKVDWTHFNSLFRESDGNYILSMRHFNQVIKINRANGEILWRLGGKRNEFKFVNDSKGIIGVHDVKKINATDLTLYDNGREGHPAAFKRYKLNERTKTIELVQKFQPDSSHSKRGLGNSQLIGQLWLYNPGIHETMSYVLRVVDKKTQPLIEVTFKDTLRSYRVNHYAELPFRIKRPVITLTREGEDLVLEAEQGHKTYLWNTGENTRRIVVQPGKNYQVWVPAATGFVSSLVKTIPTR